MARVDELRTRTYNDLIAKLKSHGKCALIRCTGFGKTVMLSKLFEDYNKIVYFYPADCVKEVVETRYASSCENVTFVTFAKLARMDEDEFAEYEDFDLIILDECHRIGALKTREKLHSFLEHNKKAHLVGATATPDRMDLVDIVHEFFDNITVFEYTLHDAFTDGIIKKPYYCYCTFDVETDLRKEALRVGLSDEEVESVISSKLIEVSKLHDIPKVISNTCNAHCSDTSYLKFIVFFANTGHMDENHDTVINWFHQAYPDYTVSSLIVRSDKKEYKLNVKKLDTLCYKKNHIDLIFCIDMLNMGYHINDITGIVMFRGTESGTIYIQQLGRALSSGSEESAVVIDIVDNLHRKALYEDIGNAQKKKRFRIRKMVEKRLEERLKKEGKEYTQEEFNALVEIEFAKDIGNWWHNCNDIDRKDLIATDHIAEYRELIAKCVAEPISMRARMAYQAWIAAGGNPEPMTRENWENEDGNERVPLKPFAWLKNVSVNAVMKEYGLI